MLLWAMEKLLALLKDSVNTGVTPGAVSVIGTASERCFIGAVGLQRLEGTATHAATIYDLASLTKVMATLPAVLRLIGAGELQLEHTVSHYVSNAGWFQSPSLADVRVQDLLTHTSGLPAWKPLFSLTNDRATAIANVLQSELAHPQGNYVYSDLGFILLGHLVERISGLRLDEFAKDQIYAPLGIQALGFGPVSGEVAATEDCGWRKQLLEGVVHDENAFIMGGVAGHAGLFGTADAVAQYAQAWLRSDPILGTENLLQQARQEWINTGPDRRGLGWVLKGQDSFAGSLATKSGYGHTGFTGTSLWLEPELDSFAVLLTNRVHPSRHATGIHELRKTFHELWLSEVMA